MKQHPVKTPPAVNECGPSHPLENQFQTQLQCAGPTSAGDRFARGLVRCGATAAKARRDDSVSDRARSRGIGKALPVGPAIRAGEDRMIEHVEEFSAKLRA